MIENILFNVSEILSEPLQLLSQESNLENIKNMISLVKNHFYQLQSEYKRIKHFENNEHFIRPDQIVVGQRRNDKRFNGITSLAYEECCISSFILNRY